MPVAYTEWLKDVREALSSINMPMNDRQKNWQFDFAAEYQAGKDPAGLLKRRTATGAAAE
jgi:hypothetical protein